MKKFFLTLILLLSISIVSNAQSMKVYQNGELKAIYYVSKDDKIEFSDDFPFPNDDPNRGHEYVDLGLSVKWATCNVGANAPEGYGDYFAWGETEPKLEYNWSTYKWCNGSSSTMTKYSTSSSFGPVDNKTTLDPEDDAAHVNWGGDWRMPTKAEQLELSSNCTWIWWTTQSGVNGYKVISKVNGNFIFLPAAGYRHNGGLYDAGSHGTFWSSSLTSGSAYGLSFSSDGVGWCDGDRDYGHTVRPVCP